MTKKLSPTKQKIIDFLDKSPNSSTKVIIDYLEISKQAAQKHLKELLEMGLISKRGSPPKVYYEKINRDFKAELSSKTSFKSTNSDEFNSNDQESIQENFALFTSDGQILKGLEGFGKWCEDRDFSVEDYAQKYAEIVTKYNSYKNSSNLIDATNKAKETYKDQCFLDKLYYSEFSAYEIFGRTKLYSYLLYGKQSEDKKLIKATVSEIKENIFRLVIEQKIDAVGFIPPTVPRKIQFQKEFEKILNLPLPLIKIEKIRGEVLIPQKTLKSPKERIENSISTIVVTEQRNFSRILLIDDFVGSGATLNFTAQKLKAKFPSIQTIIGYAISGTPNGVINHSQKFEVVSEA